MLSSELDELDEEWCRIIQNSVSTEGNESPKLPCIAQVKESMNPGYGANRVHSNSILENSSQRTQPKKNNAQHINLEDWLDSILDD